ncbi:MAG: FtsH protease activity modulator HflK [Candidatus Omnitrophica bacterium]|nr:FtsH protease activity modulator HflK [Candidatus Omnitrophota bacterium]
MEVNFPSEEGMPKMPNFRYGPWIGPVLLLAFAFMAVGTVFYNVDKDESGVVQRFGKYVRTTNPGLHLKLPFGIETVKRIKVLHVFKEEFGFRTVSSGVRTVYTGREGVQEQRGWSSRRVGVQQQRSGYAASPFLEEKMMLTGDLNVGIVEWIVQYTIKDPVAYAFRVRDPRETIRNMSEAVMRLVVGDHSINEVLTSGREEIQFAAETKLQEVLDSYGAGVAIRNVILQDVNPPDPVKPSFNEVNEARQEKEKVINQAWEEYNRVIPRAKGVAEQQIRSAEGFALERVNRANGDAERFLLTWEAYKKAPEVTKRRLYLETLEKVLPTMQDKLILDDSQKGILPLLKLNPEKGGQES